LVYGRYPNWFASPLVLFFLIAYSPARSDELDACMAKLQKANEDAQTFERVGEITCPAGDVVGFPPRVRRNDRSSVVSFAAPPGFGIKNDSVDSISIQDVSQNNGSFGRPTISKDGTTVSVPIACNGKSPGEGRSWQNIKISGTIVKVPRAEDIKSWAIQCVRCIADKNC